MQLLAIALAFVLIALPSGARAFAGAPGLTADVATIVFVASSILAYAVLLVGLARTAEAYSASSASPGLPAP